MKVQKILQLGSAFVLSLSSLLTLSIPLAHAATVTCTWTDASGIDNNFSTAGNWGVDCGGDTPGGTPGNVYNLVFPASAASFDPINDVPSLTAGTITFSGSFSSLGYDITSSSPSNVITIGGGITDNSSGSFNEIDSNLTLSGNQTFSSDVGSLLLIGSGSDTIDVGSNTLTLANVSTGDPISGSGSLVIDDAIYPTDSDGVSLLAPSPGFSGSVSVNRGALFVDDAGSLSAASAITVASGAFLKGDGGVSAATIQSGGTIAPGHSPGCISASNLTISGTYLAQLDGNDPCNDYGQLQVSNSIDVTGATLQVSVLSGFTPTAGQSFVIIDNSGSNPVTGTFNGLAEGSTFTSDGTTFQISYKGGDGNDVTLTVITPAAAGLASPAAPGTPNTGLAAIMSQPFTVLAILTAVASGLLLIARRLKPAQR